jgi:hypothetical protein
VIVLISCGAVKQDHPVSIEDLYIGGYFKQMRGWALSMVPADHCYVLSSHYGIVPFGTVKGPYDQRMGRPGSVTPQFLRQQATALGIDTESDVVMVGGKPYVKAAREVWPGAIAPFARFPGIGYQMRALKENHGRIP